MPRTKIEDENDDVGDIARRSIIGRLIVETIEVLRRGARLFIGFLFINTKNIHTRTINTNIYSRSTMITTYVSAFISIGC